MKSGLISHLPDRITVEETSRGCFHYEQSKLDWSLNEDAFVFEKRRVPAYKVQPLLRAILASRTEPADLLAEYDHPITRELLASKMKQLYSWVDDQGELPSSEDLRTEARALLASCASGSTSSVEAVVKLNAKPKIELSMSRDGSNIGPKISGLPSWKVAVGDCSWTTRSPRIAEKLLPFCSDPQGFDDILLRPEMFVEKKALELGSKRAKVTLEERLAADSVPGLRLKEVSFDDHSEWGQAEFEATGRGRIQFVYVSFKAPADPLLVISDLPGQLKEAEAKIQSLPWLEKFLRTRKVTLKCIIGSFDSLWQKLSLKGVPRICLRLDTGEELLLALEETRTVVLYPHAQLAKYLNLAPETPPYAELIVLPDGAAEVANPLEIK